MLPSRYRTDSSHSTPGGFGSVLPVHDTYLDRPVLFKSMHDPANNVQLLAEIRGLSRARSRHVVEIYDVIRDVNNDVVGIIIEKLTGPDYLNFHNQAATKPSEFLGLVYQIATALADLHHAGIVHRDLKLDNMRESSSGVLKVFDFGISCEGTGYHTKENRGTLIYAAPELYIHGVKITWHMDVYALGICCWALASNQIPAVLLEMPPQSTGSAPSIGTVLPGLFPIEVIQLLDSCLSVDQSHRPSAATVSKALLRHLVKGKHRGIFVQGGVTIYELSIAKPNVKISIGGLGEIRVSYDGTSFLITFVSGDVYINNVALQVGMMLHDSCVLTFGAFHLGSDRQWIAFLSAYPELVL